MPGVGPTILVAALEVSVSPSVPAQPGAGLGAQGMLIPGGVGALSPALSRVCASEGTGSVWSRPGLSRVGTPGVTPE